MYAIKNLDKLYDKPVALQEKVFLRLFEQAEIAKFTPTELYDYEESLKIFRDWYSVMQTQKKESYKEGLEKGLKKGLEKGRTEGERLKAIDIAQKLKSINLPIEKIVEATGLYKQEIEKL